MIALDMDDSLVGSEEQSNQSKRKTLHGEFLVPLAGSEFSELCPVPPPPTLGLLESWGWRLFGAKVFNNKDLYVKSSIIMTYAIRLSSSLKKSNHHRSFRIKRLGKNSRQIFEFKRLICKIFRNKDLAQRTGLKTVLGQFGGAILIGGTRRTAPILGRLSQHAGGCVCDELHRQIVMKKSLALAEVERIVATSQ
jgi:hypothetical protein